MSLAASTTMKPSIRRLPLPIIIFVICAIVGFLLLYTESISLLSYGSIFRIKSCARRNPDNAKTKYEQPEENSHEAEMDDRFDFDPEECDMTKGKWVFNSSFKPLYSDRTCPYVDRQFSCVKNGRTDFDYRQWEWQPEDCNLPRFDPVVALEKLSGKRLLFVGDSIQRSQWESFVCLVDSAIPDGKKSMKSSRSHSIFKAHEYNATIEFNWAPFLVESNSDGPKLETDRMKRVIKLDSVERHAKRWTNADILVFNTYVWWMSGLKHRTLWGSFANGEEGTEWLETRIAYRMSLKTWANWIDSNIDANKTRVFFTTMSPTHTTSADWGKINGTKCFNETKPITKKKFWSSGADKKMMKEVTTVIKHMQIPVSVLNVTQLSDYRIDAHSSIWTENGGKLLTEEQKADPLHHADCIHWCLPGVPDTWNQIFLAHL